MAELGASSSSSTTAGALYWFGVNETAGLG
jgi:hypothetical protein